jgi:hypothetical protein
MKERPIEEDGCTRTGGLNLTSHGLIVSEMSFHRCVCVRVYHKLTILLLPSPKRTGPAGMTKVT